MSYGNGRLPPDFGGEVQQSLFETRVYKSAGVEQILNSGILYSGQAYQRPVSQRDVDELVQLWDEALFEPPIVSYRKGKYHLVDGQRRVSAIRQMNGGRDANILCRVFHDLTYEDEALLLYRLDKAKKRMTLSQSTNARIQSGQDSVIRSIRKELNEEGFEWILNRRNIGNYHIHATSAVLRAYNVLGRSAFGWMFRLLRATWQGSPASIGAFMLNGMTLFLKTYETDIDEQTFVRRLSAYEPDALLDLAKQDTSTTRRDLRCARVLLEKYNKGCRTERQLPRRAPI
ncbi:MAG: hypothetical protein IJK52_13440 [Oscillospiraceae bacterium]|nr:hypothetical protein [Oscillospiraceae bacterium]